MNPESPNQPWLTNIAELKQAYRSTHHILIKAKEAAHPPEEQQLIAEMIADVNYAIEWMHTGKCPGNRRGIERRAAYQREKLVDPFQMQIYMQQYSPVTDKPAAVTELQRIQIEQALAGLSTRERECYELHHGMSYSLSEIAELLGVKKGTVQGYVQTASKKVVQAKQGEHKEHQS
ncbi:RNA polymerase sigma-70 factor, ECF subfamily [Paenibacillus sp. 1_12]|uniref:sigma-70 family RNA polymerase sigma factor n=1 Tax=Paenibacillus sp. 1_12 TaxID=1566278 RepID=UPI0008E45EE9|nr:sigma-70 family RNA polymerase sigma factor [Paenibacillus sp. 1_12]SFL09551.1 RNA polymerase sigma-70 factor, ECF subfamily [Paenibacillus sp. 1_12]